MHSTFSATVAGWQNFYILAGTASATLIGLIFVAVSIHLDIFVDEAASALFAGARRTFGRFIIVLTIALMFVVPGQSPLGLGIPLLVIGLLDMQYTLRLAVVVWRKPQRALARSGTVRWSSLTQFLPLLSGAGITVTAVTLLLGSTELLYWMVGVIAVILTNVAQESWTLMFNLAKTKNKKIPTAT